MLFMLKQKKFIHRKSLGVVKLMHNQTEDKLLYNNYKLLCTKTINFQKVLVEEETAI